LRRILQQQAYGLAGRDHRPGVQGSLDANALVDPPGYVAVPFPVAAHEGQPAMIEQLKVFGRYSTSRKSRIDSLA